MHVDYLMHFTLVIKYTYIIVNNCLPYEQDINLIKRPQKWLHTVNFRKAYPNVQNQHIQKE